MRVLSINGSPKGKRSNTYRLTKSFIAGLEKKEEIQLKELTVCSMNIRPCLGCFSCWNKTPGNCCIDDDMASAIDSILWADLVIWSFPLYYFSIPGGLKNFIDRQLPMVMPFMSQDSESGGHPSRYDMSQKRHVVISTCGFHTAKGNYDGVTSVFDHMYGKDNYSTIFCGQGELFRVKELAKQTDVYLGIVEQAGAEYAAEGITESTKRLLDVPLFPRETFEAMADASWGVKGSDGVQEDVSLVFTRQMAALYNKQSYQGKQLVLEMYYTDIGKTYQIVLGEKGSEVHPKPVLPYTTRIETPYRLWKSIAEGEITGQEALMQQKYRVKGDFDLMIHWDDYFGVGQAKQVSQKNKKQKGTDMTILLLPWIVFWIAIPINGYYGSLISVAVCALLPLLFYQNRKTLYDILSTVLITCCALLLLNEIPAIVILPLSYFLFGTMWTASCFQKIPLTAWYSMNDYNGESAFENPLFVKTNWILTLCWGILYLLTPTWTYFIMGTEFASWTGAINSMLPALMGIFTAWFQKWYPAKIARGD